MVSIDSLNIKGKTVEGVCIATPGGEGHPNMLVLKCEKGYVMCGYLNIELAEDKGDAACIIGGATFQDLLANPVKAVTSEAKNLGVEIGMSGEEACAKLSGC